MLPRGREPAGRRAEGGEPLGSPAMSAKRAMGTLALIGGGEWRDGCRDFDAELLATARATEVFVVLAAAAFEHPDRVAERATAYFGSLGAKVVAPMVLHRSEAEAPKLAEAVRKARFVYIADGSPLHLRSVLKGSALWTRCSPRTTAARSSPRPGAGATLVCDPMVDPRGGAYTVGLGIVTQPRGVPVPRHRRRPPARAVDRPAAGGREARRHRRGDRARPRPPTAPGVSPGAGMVTVYTGRDADRVRDRGPSAARWRLRRFSNALGSGGRRRRLRRGRGGRGVRVAGGDRDLLDHDGLRRARRRRLAGANVCDLLRDVEALRDLAEDGVVGPAGPRRPCPVTMKNCDADRPVRIGRGLGHRHRAVRVRGRRRRDLALRPCTGRRRRRPASRSRPGSQALRAARTNASRRRSPGSARDTKLFTEIGVLRARARSSIGPQVVSSVAVYCWLASMVCAAAPWPSSSFAAGWRRPSSHFTGAAAFLPSSPPPLLIADDDRRSR